MTCSLFVQGLFTTTTTLMQLESDLESILAYSGKRNCAFTFVIGKISTAELKKHIESVSRKVAAIKHKNKAGRQKKELFLFFSLYRCVVDAGQGKRVLDFVKDFFEQGNVSDVIVCCGLGEGDKISLFQLNIPTNAVLVENFEYYYDYVFHAERIKEILFCDVCVTSDESKLMEQLNKMCNQSSPLLFLGKEETLRALFADERRLGSIVMFGGENLDMKTLEQCRAVGVKINKLSADKTGFCDKWGSLFGIARY